MSNPTINENDIAVIGLSGRFPQAENIDQYWANILAGADCITREATDQASAGSGQSYEVFARGLLQQAEHFDAFFFNITPNEAQLMDPQHRVFLECAWHALEDAGCLPEQTPGKIGIYAGTSVSTYLLERLVPQKAQLDTYLSYLGNHTDVLALRVANKLNLTGPAVTVQTCCSTSLVAIHMACQSLLLGESDVVLAGGVSVNGAEQKSYRYEANSILSSDGYCRAFDAQASGTVFSDGVGAVVLKRLSDAKADGDDIYCVIKGSCINNDGADKVAFTAPSIAGQQEVISEALYLADVDPATVGYIEAHGTGTAVGDPIEFTALCGAYGQSDDKQYCGLGTIKANIGHLDAAAGVAGFIKAALMLKHQKIPPQANYSQAHPQINLVDSPFYIATQAKDWAVGPHSRKVGISAFGVGGTNAHIILEEALEETPEEAVVTEPVSAPDSYILPVSGKTHEAVLRQAERLKQYVQSQATSGVEINLSDLAYTLQCRKQAFDWHGAVVLQQSGQLIAALAADQLKPVYRQGQTPVVFMFPGQGERQLAEAIFHCHQLSEFKAIFTECLTLLGEPYDALLLVLDDGAKLKAIIAAQETNTGFIQPLMFSFSYALARYWQSCGIVADELIGHSLGEYVAATLAGVFELKEVLILIKRRAQLMQSVAPGSMLAVSCEHDKATDFITDDIALATVNNANSVVFSGPTSAIEQLEQTLSAQHINHKRLATTRAFHSRMLDPIISQFKAAFSALTLNRPQLPLIANVSGQLMTDAQATSADYWVSQMRQQVLFYQGIKTLDQQGPRIYVEMGPGATLSRLVKPLINAHSSTQLGLGASLSTDIKRIDAQQSHYLITQAIAQAMAQLWCHSGAVDWSVLYQQQQRQKLRLPEYAFERVLHCVPALASTAPQAAKPAADQATNKAIEKAKTAQNLFYLPSWARAAKLDQQLNLGAYMGGRHNWLILAPQLALGEQFVQRLQQFGQTVTVIVPGPSFAKLAKGVYSVRPGERSDFDLLASELRAFMRLPSAIIDLWAFTQTPQTSDLAQAKDHHFYSLLALWQAFSKLSIELSIDITVAANRLWQVTGDDVVDPGKALGTGPLKAMLLESAVTNINFKSVVRIDIGEHQEDTLPVHWLDEMIKTTKSADDGIELAFRHQYKWGLSVVEQPLAAVSGLPSLLKPAGVYLIFGGFGGLGQVIASQLSQVEGVTLVLVSRSSLADAFDARAQLGEQLEQLRQNGAKLDILTADISCQSDVQNVVAQTLAKHQKISGVIQAAGIAGGGLATLRSKAQMEAVFAPKLSGTRFIGEALMAHAAENSVDFYVLFSSLAAISGFFGQVDYCAANAYLDAYADDFAVKSGIRTISINWDTWKETGMAVAAAGDLSLAEQQLHKGLSSSEGAEAFWRILNSPHDQIIVSRQSLAQANATAVVARPAQTRPAQTTAEPSEGPTIVTAASERPTLSTPYVAPTQEVEVAIAAIWSQVIGMQNIGIDDDFFELGGNSLLAIQIHQGIVDHFAMDIALASILDHCNIKALSIHVEECLIAELEQD